MDFVHRIIVVSAHRSFQQQNPHEPLRSQCLQTSLFGILRTVHVYGDLSWRAKSAVKTHSLALCDVRSSRGPLILSANCSKRAHVRVQKRASGHPWTRFYYARQLHPTGLPWRNRHCRRHVAFRRRSPIRLAFFPSGRWRLLCANAIATSQVSNVEERD